MSVLPGDPVVVPEAFVPGPATPATSRMHPETASATSRERAAESRRVGMGLTVEGSVRLSETIALQDEHFLMFAARRALLFLSLPRARCTAYPYISDDGVRAAHSPDRARAWQQ